MPPQSTDEPNISISRPATSISISPGPETKQEAALPHPTTPQKRRRAPSDPSPSQTLLLQATPLTAQPDQDELAEEDVTPAIPSSSNCNSASNVGGIERLGSPRTHIARKFAGLFVDARPPEQEQEQHSWLLDASEGEETTTVMAARSSSLNPRPAAKASKRRRPAASRSGSQARSGGGHARSPPLTSTEVSPLTWRDDEITGHLLLDPAEDDGTGLNGIGFRPTAQEAQRRALRRREQVLGWKARVAREDRKRRGERRRGGGGGGGGEPGVKRGRVVRFTEG